MTYITIRGDELYHHGVKGMKWGVRRYQNRDGSLKNGARRNTEKSSGGVKQFMKRRARNYENYRNYRRAQQEAEDKFDLDVYRSARDSERERNRAATKSINSLFGTEFDEDTFSPLGDKHAQAYRNEAKKAKEYTEQKFIEKYGEQKLEQAKKTEAFIGGAQLAAIMGVGLGVFAYGLSQSV